jgi:hypothetical protein
MDRTGPSSQYARWRAPRSRTLSTPTPEALSASPACSASPPQGIRGGLCSSTRTFPQGSWLPWNSPLLCLESGIAHARKLRTWVESRRALGAGSPSTRYRTGCVFDLRWHVQDTATPQREPLMRDEALEVLRDEKHAFRYISFLVGLEGAQWPTL